MRKGTLIITSLLLVSLVLAGASCGEEERRKKDKDEDEEEEELLEKKLTNAQIEDVLMETAADLGWGYASPQYSEDYGFYVERIVGLGMGEDYTEHYTRLQIGDISEYSDEVFAEIIEGATKETFIKKWCQYLSDVVFAYDPAVTSTVMEISGFDACYTDIGVIHNVTRAFVGNYEAVVEHWNNTGEGEIWDSRTLLKALIDNILDALEEA